MRRVVRITGLILATAAAWAWANNAIQLPADAGRHVAEYENYHLRCETDQRINNLPWCEARELPKGETK